VSNWWEAAPLAGDAAKRAMPPPKATSGEWWEAAPLAADAAKAKADPPVDPLGGDVLKPMMAPPGRAERAGAAVGDVLNRILPDNPTARDVIQSAASSVPKGIAGLAGLPVDALNMMRSGAGWLAGQPVGLGFRGMYIDPPAAPLPGGKADFEAPMRDLGMLHDPQTTAGKFADTMGQFATQGGLLGGARAFFMGLGGGAGSEVGGQLAEGTPAEPWARLSGGLLGTGLTGVALPSSNPGLMLRERLAGTTADDFATARARMAEGQARGVPLSPAEAIDARPVQGLAADTLASPTGGPQMGRFFDQRAATLPNTIRNEIAPDLASAPGYMRAAGTRNAGQALTQEAQRAGYTAANPQSIDPQALRPVIQRLDNAIMTSPADVRRQLMALRNDIIENGVPITNINRLDTVRQTFAERINNMAEGVPQNAIRRAMQPILDDVNAALQTNPQFAAGQAAYRQGAPASQLLRQADDVLETAAKPTQAGPTRMAGVNFRNQMLGGPGSQQAQETEALIREAATRAGANPDQAWQGAQRVFDVLERTGRIPGVGSQTGGRLRAGQEAANTGAIGQLAQTEITAPLRFVDRIMANTVYRNAYRQLGNLFTNPSPEAIDIMQRMARMSDQSAALLLPSLLATARDAGSTP